MPERKKGTCIIFRNASGQVLLFLRDDKAEIAFPDCWDIPGGSLEQDETPEEAIKREMLEEIEFDLDDPQLFKIYEMEDRVEYTFWKQADLDIHALPLHEGQAMKWFSLEDIQKLADNRIAFNFKPVLLDFYRETPWQP